MLFRQEKQKMIKKDVVVIQFEYYVLNYNHSKHQVEPYNIFNNIRVQEYSEKAVKKYLKNPKKFTYSSFDGKETICGFDAFVKELDSIIMCEEWCRVEYEISAGNAFEDDCKKLKKIDCYYQAHANIEMVAREVIYQYKQYRKENKD